MAATRCRPCAGLEDIATEGNDPAHGGWFNDLAKVGWGTPKAIYSDPEVATALPLKVNQLLLGDSLKTSDRPELLRADRPGCSTGAVA